VFSRAFFLIRHPSFAVNQSTNMSMIKKFFEKKKADAKFKLAGKGVKLGDAHAAEQAQAARAGPSQPRPGPSTTGNRNLTDEQRQAAEAALMRLISFYVFCLSIYFKKTYYTFPWLRNNQNIKNYQLNRTEDGNAYATLQKQQRVDLYMLFGE